MMKVTKFGALLLPVVALVFAASNVPAAEPKMTDTHIFLHSKAKNKAGKEVKTYFPGFPGLGIVPRYNRAWLDRVNKGFPQGQGHEARRIQWVKAARMPFA